MLLSAVLGRHVTIIHMWLTWMFVWGKHIHHRVWCFLSFFFLLFRLLLVLLWIYFLIQAYLPIDCRIYSQNLYHKNYSMLLSPCLSGSITYITTTELVIIRVLVNAWRNGDTKSWMSTMDSTLIWYHYSQGKHFTAIGLDSEKGMYTKVGISPPGIETGSFHTQVALFLHQGTFPTMTCDTAKDFHAPISTQLLLHSHVHVLCRKRMRNLVSASRYRVCRGSPNLVVMGSPIQNITLCWSLEDTRFHDISFYVYFPTLQECGEITMICYSLYNLEPINRRIILREHLGWSGLLRRLFVTPALHVKQGYHKW